MGVNKKGFVSTLLYSTTVSDFETQVSDWCGWRTKHGSFGLSYIEKSKTATLGKFPFFFCDSSTPRNPLPVRFRTKAETATAASSAVQIDSVLVLIESWVPRGVAGVLPARCSMVLNQKRFEV